MGNLGSKFHYMRNLGILSLLITYPRLETVAYTAALARTTR